MKFYKMNIETNYRVDCGAFVSKMFQAETKFHKSFTHLHL